MKCILLSAAYQNRQAILKFYHPDSDRVILVKDRTNHLSHCYVLPETANQLSEWPGISDIEEVELLNTIKDEKQTVFKISTDNPLVIGGRDDSIRERFKTWESDIKYYQTYIYDRKLVVGKWYNIDPEGNIESLPNDNNTFDLSNIDMDSVVDTKKFEEQLKLWADILSEPIPDIKRLAFDIEVESTKDQLPDPQQANQRVTAISFHSSDGVKKCFTLNRPEIPKGEEDKDKDYDLVWYDSEKELLEDSFKLIESYPVVLTYNGDMFDMPYLYNRAINLEIEHNPFKMMKNNATLNLGIHIDMYGVFSNRSLKIYAFNAKYVEEGLDSVSSALLGEHKTEYEGELNDIPLNLLSKYCYNDSRLTFELSHYDNNLVMNLLIILCRIGNMPIDDISRLAISNWIKSMLYFHHRLNNELIPRSDDFPDIKASTTADIEGKKYQGAIVLDQEKGIHFDVTVMDFASLYPSIIKTRNVSYDTICCPHDECKSNNVPYTDHWSCTKKQGAVSLLIGSLKELRVNHFKQLAKNAKDDKEKNINDTIAQALKVFLNASYGVVGFESFPLFFLPAAEAVTAIGRNIISQTVEAAKSKELPVLAGDTDSIFVKKPTQEQIDYLIDFCRQHYAIDLEVDKEYRYLVLSGRKKNYFGIKKDGKIDIKGLSGKKSNTPPFVKELFTDVLDDLKTIMKPDDFPEIKKIISDKIKKTYTSFEEIPLEKLAFKVMINKEPHEYRTKPQALKAAEQLPGKPEKGQFIQFVKTWKKPHVKPISLVKREEIDKKKYVLSLESVMEQVVEPMDIDIDCLLGRGKALKMDSFF